MVGLMAITWAAPEHEGAHNGRVDLGNLPSDLDPITERGIDVAGLDQLDDQSASLTSRQEDLRLEAAVHLSLRDHPEFGPDPRWRISKSRMVSDAVRFGHVCPGTGSSTTASTR